MRFVHAVCLMGLLVLFSGLVFVEETRALPLAQETIHIVRSGETLSTIAQQYGVAVEDIVQANHLQNPNAIYVGQKLRIPKPGASGSAATPNAPGVHIVQPGETLSSIAEQYGVTPQDIARASGIGVDDILHVGQRLTIPGQAPSAGQVTPEPTAQPQPQPISGTYIVRPGDTLASIAQRFGVPVASLARANRLSSPSLIFVGRRLIIPKPKIAQLRGGGKRVEVSISHQRCDVYDGDTLLYEWKCSTGRRGSPTKPGTYHIQSKLRKAYGSSWNIWMPYWLGVYWAGGTENGFHGLPWNAATGRETWTGLVGRPITYGCIMLSNENAKILWNMAYIGMPITIQY
ncbi:MAG: LysM peptidoglycan-binding domain-containing protein [Anaerolineae bacterium]|nr:LysM peptidoglycan-binding domain-containing protein [Anaerolineae bacterium]